MHGIAENTNCINLAGKRKVDIKKANATNKELIHK
jgi:hypothetical protein